MCSDFNECFESPNICSPFGTCENLEGDYRCNCLKGWQQDSSHSCIGQFTKICLRSAVGKSVLYNSIGKFENCFSLDINECSQVPQPCQLKRDNNAGPNNPYTGICTNLDASYDCGCTDGFESPSSDSSICQGLTKQSCDINWVYVRCCSF